MSASAHEGGAEPAGPSLPAGRTQRPGSGLPDATGLAGVQAQGRGPVPCSCAAGLAFMWPEATYGGGLTFEGTGLSFR